MFLAPLQVLTNVTTHSMRVKSQILIVLSRDPETKYRVLVSVDVSKPEDEETNDDLVDAEADNLCIWAQAVFGANATHSTT